MNFLQREYKVSRLEHAANVKIRNRMKKNSTNTDKTKKRRMVCVCAPVPSCVRTCAFMRACFRMCVCGKNAYTL